MNKKRVIIIATIIATLLIVGMNFLKYDIIAMWNVIIMYILFLPIGIYFYKKSNRGYKPIYETLILIILLSVCHCLFILGSLEPYKVLYASTHLSLTLIISIVIAYIVYQFDHMSE